MKSLPETFRQDGFDFRILRRRGRVALLVKRKPGLQLESFEVVLIRTLPERKAFGKYLPAAEYLPNSESWGICGWTFTTREDAERRFESEATRRENASQLKHPAPQTAFSAPGKVGTADSPEKRATARAVEVPA